MRLTNGTLPWPYIDPEKALPWIEQKTGMKLAETQVAAIRLALLSKTMVITGGPGVGKTTIVNSILRILSAKGVDILLCAPTGRAAKRMTEATGFEAKTIHRLLEVDPKGGGFKRGKRLVVLVGQKKAVAIAVKNVSGRRRWSKLREWLRPATVQR